MKPLPPTHKESKLESSEGVGHGHTGEGCYILRAERCVSAAPIQPDM